MTKDEFEQASAARSGITVAELHALGRYAAPCGDEDCQGWQMVHVEEIRPPHDHMWQFNPAGRYYYCPVCKQKSQRV